VPVTTYEISPFGQAWYHHEPSYKPLIQLERRYGDSFVWAPTSPVIAPVDPSATHVQDVAEADGTVRHTMVLTTPKGELRSVWQRDPARMTHWRIEPMIKSDEDIARVLSLPDTPPAVDPERIRALQRQAADQAVLLFSIGDAIGHVAGLFDFEEFVMRCYEDDSLVRELLAKVHKQLCEQVKAIGRVVREACFRLWGPEYCGAPLMDPDRFFQEYVVQPDRELTDWIHETGNLSIVHCHGRLRQLLEPILQIGADALEPLETLPMTTADVTMAELKQRLGAHMCLMGGMQAPTLERGTPEQVADQAETAIREGAGDGGFVLLPTAAPVHIPLDEATIRNYEVMFRVAHAHRY